MKSSTTTSNARAQPAFHRAACVAALLLMTSARAYAEEPAAFSIAGADFLGDAPGAVTVGAGALNALSQDGDDASAELRIEYRVGEKWNALAPLFGVLATSEGAVFGYLALYTDIRVGERWYITPAAGFGGYAEGDDKDLGGVFQFHLGLDLSYRLDSGHRLGLKVAHISNAFIHDRNPGAESLLLTYTLPLGL